MEPAHAVLAYTPAEISRTILQHSTRRVQLLLPDRSITMAEERVPPVNREHPVHHHPNQRKPSMGGCAAGRDLPEPVPKLGGALHCSCQKPDRNTIPYQIPCKDNCYRSQLRRNTRNNR